MNIEQRVISKMIIEIHKQNHGNLDIEYVDLEEILGLPTRKSAPIIHDLLYEGYVYQIREGYTRLTTKGWEFVSWKVEREKSAEEKRINELGVEKLKLEVDELNIRLKDYKTTKRQAKIAIICSVFSAIISALALLLQ